MDSFMQSAFEQAKLGYAQSNLPVGSVIVSNHEIIGAGRNRQIQTRDPTTHAELEAIRDASSRVAGDDIVGIFSGATCYTTMMPCAMCAGAIIRFGFARVVVAETRSYVPSGSHTLMERQGLAVEIQQQPVCIALVEDYFREHPGLREKMKQTGRPVLTL